MIKFDKALEYTLTFTHLNGKPARFTAAYNKLTGEWLQEHTVGEDSSAYTAPKRDAERLFNNIIRISKEKSLPCELTTANNRLTKV